MKPKVMVCSNSFGRVVNDGVRLLEDVAVIERIDSVGISEAEFVGKLRQCTGIISFPRAYSDIVLSSRGLKIVALRGAGHGVLDLDRATRNGIVVTFVPEENSTSVAELTMGLLLAITKRIPDAVRSVKEGRWERLTHVGVELDTKTIGIIGLGAIGRKVARMMGGFGVKELAYDPFVTEEQARKLNVKLVSLQELLAESDFITIHCPLTEDTEGLIDAAALACVKPSAYIINAARGQVVDRIAVAEALQAGRLAGYSTDVLAEEPPVKDDPLIYLNRVICTPHIGGYTMEAARRVDLAVARDVVAALEERTPERTHILNPEVLAVD